jgi:hemerythrin-like domain-containing protein
MTRCIEDRRALLQSVGSVLGLALVGCSGSNETPSRVDADEADDAEVTPGEDLMQEHAVIERILLVYDEAARRIDREQKLDLAIITTAATIVRRFVEDYHERLEEQHVFPRLVAARREAQLISVLRAQHERGRELTDEIGRRATAALSPELADSLRAFGQMYRPHAAREGSVLVPALREVVGRKAYAELGEQFEEAERSLLGERGFDETVAEIAKLESALDMAELEGFPGHG